MPDPAPENFDTIPQTEALESGATETREASTLPGDFIPTLATGLPPGLVDHPRYRILQYLGGGGMGAVYKALHRVMDRIVALKVINPAYVSRADAVARFEQEVRAAARLSHPNIVTAYDAEQAGDAHFLVMEYVEGVNLAQVLAQAKREFQVKSKSPAPSAAAPSKSGLGTVPRHPGLSIGEACDYVRQAALGLQHAFEKGMVHRDIKPLNLMRDRQGCIKILDFGLARFASESGKRTHLTAEGTVLGTPDYMAPEQAQNSRSADIRADIYSLGCTLYHLLTGSAPYPEGTTFTKMMSHVEAKPKPLKDFRVDLPAKLDQIVSRMMAKEPASRYQTPRAVADALEPFAAGNASGSRTVGKITRRRLLLVVLLLAVVGGAASLAYTLLWTKQGPSPKAHEAEATAAKESATDKENLLWPVQAILEGRIAAPDLSHARVLYDKERFDDLPANTFSGVKAAPAPVAKGTPRATTIRKGTTVFPATQSAMFDDRVVDRPNEFHTDRPAYLDMHFGYGMHACFGKYVNRVQIPGILKPLLKKARIARAGAIEYDGPFPSSLRVYLQ